MSNYFIDLALGMTAEQSAHKTISIVHHDQHKELSIPALYIDTFFPRDPNNTMADQYKFVLEAGNYVTEIFGRLVKTIENIIKEPFHGRMHTGSIKTDIHVRDSIMLYSFIDQYFTDHCGYIAQIKDGLKQAITTDLSLHYALIKFINTDFDKVTDLKIANSDMGKLVSLAGLDDIIAIATSQMIACDHEKIYINMTCNVRRVGRFYSYTMNLIKDALIEKRIIDLVSMGMNDTEQLIMESLM